MIDSDFWHQPLWVYFAALGFMWWGAWTAHYLLFRSDDDDLFNHRRE
jgi:hypothetical protein